MVGRYPHTLDMARADEKCLLRHVMGLREYVLHWRVEHPRATLNELAVQLGIDRGTLNNWLDLLRIARGGVGFIDLDAEPAAEAAA